MEGQEIRGLMEAYSQVYETPEVLDEAPMTAFQAAGGQAKLDQLNKNRSPRSGRATAASIEKLGQDNLFIRGGGNDAIAKGPTRNQNVRGGRSVKVPTLTRQDIINRGTVAAAKPAKPGTPPAPAKPGTTPAAAKPGTTPAAAKPGTPAAPAKPGTPAAPAKPGTPAAAKPTTPAAPAKPAPGTKAAGPESIKPKTPNPLMQKTFGYQTGNAPDQIAKASAGKPTPSGSALGSAADPKVRAALNLPSKSAASLSQAPAPKPAEAPKPQMSARAQALKTGGPAGSARERMLNQDLDIFDIIKGHLLDEGYADSEEGAMVIMVNMSEEWRESILESHGVELDEAQRARENPEEYERSESRRQSKRERAMNDPHTGINSPAFAEFMRQQMGGKKKKG